MNSEPMRQLLISLLTGLALCTATHAQTATAARPKLSPRGYNTVSVPLHTYVDPRIGSEGEGRTFIGPCAPFGMVKPCPDAVSMPNAGWAPMPGAIKGFSQTHVSGTGGGQKYGNVLLQPFLRQDKPVMCALLLPDGSKAAIPVYGYERTEEQVELGRYACTYDNGISTEVTAADRCAFYRIRGATALLVDAASFLGMDTIPDKREAQQYVGSDIRPTAPRELCGHTTVRGGWNNGGPYTVFFCLQADGPVEVARADSLHAILYFSGPMGLKVGISYVSEAQARRNIVPGSFDGQVAALRCQWEDMLRRVPYRGTPRDRRMFYTALYHTLLMPIDKTGEREGWGTEDYYDDYYALWDTYRTSFPLLMEYYPERAAAMIRSLLNIYRHEGYLPDARSGDCNGRTQGGSNAEVVIAEAFARGLKGIDYDLALEAMIHDAEVVPADDEKEGRGGLAEYNRLGYIPYGIARAGTRTVEYSYDDWCIAQVARGLGYTDLYERYLRRSSNWRNLWRGDYEWQGMRGFIMPRDAHGVWLDSVPWGRSAAGHHLIAYKPDTKVAPWHIAWWDTFFYEALSAEYSLSVPHDVPTLIGLCGGDSAFRRRLDIFFGNHHYNVGNEPSFLTPYLYHYIGRPDLSSRRVAQIVRENFFDTPDGLPGNDDSGAMSAWLLWAMLGKYPVAGQGTYLSIAPVHFAPATVQPRRPQPKSLPAVPPAPADYAVHFTLNRQYRTWPLSYRYEDDGLSVSCLHSQYIIPQRVLDHATTFAWERPTDLDSRYRCSGTFLMISRDAYCSLEARHQMQYDGLTWRELDRSDSLIHVRSDLDGSEMWIRRTPDLPLVERMQGNKLGIDWWVERRNLPAAKEHSDD